MKKKKAKFAPSTPKERIGFLRNAIKQLTEYHGAPCMCILCEALQFDFMAANGEINLKTGERKQ